jgi:predicted Ser/Thr protein kinase
VAFSDDVLFVGSPTDSSAGAVYVFERPNMNTFILQTKLYGDPVEPGYNFGYSLSVGQSTLAVGSVGYNDEELGAFVLGSVFIFDNTSEGWIQTSRIQPGGITSSDYFGYSVGIDYNWLVVGAPYAKSQTGGAYLFHRTNATSPWLGDSVLVQRDAQNLTSGAKFGSSVSISGNNITIGAPGISGGGVIFVLTDFGYNGTWSNQIQLTGVSPQQDDGFGFSASIETKHLFVGSPLLSLDQGTAQSGAAFTFSVQNMNDRTLIITQDNGTIFVTPLAPLSPPPVAPFSFAPVEPEFPPSNNSSNNTAITTPLPDSSQTGSDFSVYLPAVLVPAGVVVIGVIIFAVLYTKYKAKQHARRMGILNPMQSQVLNDTRLTVPFQSLSVKTEIGSGSYGKVYKGVWNATQVALKFCNELASVDKFSEEATLMLNIPPHPNVVQLLAISIDGPVPVIVLEYCEGGSMDQDLFDSVNQVSEQKMLHIVAGIARGMYHLHNSDIIHRDLAARNILLQHGEPKISDFGMSRIIKASEGQTKSNIGPIRWMAPESLANQTYSTKTDVWTFGIVVYEIVARQEPHIDGDALLIAAKIRDEHLTPVIPKDCPEILREIMQSCWQADPEARPEFKDICARLSHIA